MRKKMPDIIKIMLAAALTAAMLAGCSSNEKNNTKEESSTGTEAAVEETGESNEEQDGELAADPFVFTPLIHEESIYGGVSRNDISIDYTIKYQSALLDEKSAEVYPELSEALIRDKDFQQKQSESSVTDFTYTADVLADNDFHNGMMLTDEILTSVVRADENVLSLRKECYWYNAGAHGNYYTIGVTYDTQTGEKLSLYDVIDNNVDQLIEITERIIRENYSEVPSGIDYLAEVLTEGGDDVYGESDFEAGFGWTLGYNQLELYFNPYTLGSYAEGQHIVKIAFDDYPELFNKRYTENISDAYIYRLNDYDDLTYEDIDLDGENEEIKLSMVLNGAEDYPEEYTLTVGFDDKSYNTSLRSYVGYENYFVKAGNGGCYIYSFTKHDNDYVILDIFKITRDGLIASNAGNLEPAIISSEYTSEDDTEEGNYLSYFNILKYSLTNPDMLKLSSRLDALSTYTAYKSYRVDEEGRPCSDLPFKVNSSIVLKLKEDFEFEECYHTGKRKGKSIVLPAGTELYIHLTNGSSYIVLGHGDEEYVYAEIDVNTYPQLINGRSSEEVFDGLFYAG